MKKLLSTVAVVLAFAINSLATTAVNVDRGVVDQFGVEFKNATNVQWSASSDFYHATFELNDKKIDAFYDLKGQLISTSENIDFATLPVEVKRQFAKKYAGFTVNEVIKMDTQQDGEYFLSASKGNEKIILKVIGKSLSIFK